LGCGLAAGKNENIKVLYWLNPAAKPFLLTAQRTGENLSKIPNIKFAIHYFCQIFLTAGSKSV